MVSAPEKGGEPLSKMYLSKMSQEEEEEEPQGSSRYSGDQCRLPEIPNKPLLGSSSQQTTPPSTPSETFARTDGDNLTDPTPPNVSGGT